MRKTGARRPSRWRGPSCAPRCRRGTAAPGDVGHARVQHRKAHLVRKVGVEGLRGDGLEVLAEGARRVEVVGGGEGGGRVGGVGVGLGGCGDRCGDEERG